ncbi:MAG: hypothetical protein ACR2FX_08780 [Chthoniobacterales bacterium]
MITVRHLSGEEYEVTVESTTRSAHRVTLREADRARLAGKNCAAERLIEESFNFLLEREPNTSILRRFDLPVIASYFPEYQSEIRKRVS